MPALILCLAASGVATRIGWSLCRDDVTERGRPRWHSLAIRNTGTVFVVIVLTLVVIQ